MISATVALVVFLLNIPFGYWRIGLRKLSPLWLVAIQISMMQGVVTRW